MKEEKELNKIVAVLFISALLNGILLFYLLSGWRLWSALAVLVGVILATFFSE